MNKKNQLAKNTIILLIGKISTKFISFLLIPLYTSKFVTIDYGFVDLIITYILLLSPIISLQLESACFRFITEYRKDENKCAEIINIIFSLLIKLVLFYSIFYFILLRFISIKYGIYIYFAVVFCIFNDVFLQVLRGFGDNIKYSIACFINGITNVLFNVVFIVFLKLGAQSILLSMIISNLVTIVYMFFSANFSHFISLKNSNNKNLKKEILKYSLPLIPNGISWWVMNVSDRTIISYYLGLSVNGIYAVASKFPGIVSTLFSIYNLSWAESATLNVNTPNRDAFFTDIFNVTTDIVSSISLLLISFMSIAFSYLIGSSYSDAYNYIPILILATFFSCLMSFLSSIYIATKNTKKLARISLISAAINILVHLLLIRYIKLYAACISTIIAYLVVLIYEFVDIYKHIKIKINLKKNIIHSAIFVLVMITYYCKIMWLNTVVFLLCVIYLIYINKAIIKSIICKVKNTKNKII